MPATRFNMFSTLLNGFLVYINKVCNEVNSYFNPLSLKALDHHEWMKDPYFKASFQDFSHFKGGLFEKSSLGVTGLKKVKPLSSCSHDNPQDNQTFFENRTSNHNYLKYHY